MTLKKVLMTTAAAGLLAACDTPLDFDLRDLARGFDTSKSIKNLPNRPKADNRGIISYPNYQVAVAEKDDTIVTIAKRLGLTSDALAKFNGIEVDVPLRKGELIALPTRVAEPSAATGAAQSGPIQPSTVDVTAIATSALDRAGPQETASAQASQPAQTGLEPVRHKVKRGETVFSISRIYNVPVRSISDWNSLGPELSVREGQFLLVPQSGQAAPAPQPTAAPAPGAGSDTPFPPSATLPLPDETPSVPVAAANVPKAPDIGTPTTKASTFAYPVQGSIIRAYASGRNEGIDIGVPAGTSVKAAGTGSVAAVTTDTSGSAIVVVKHDGGLLTVYTNLEGLTVAKGASVSKGQTIGKVRGGDPSFLHFEVRRGLSSVDPADFLP